MTVGTFAVFQLALRPEGLARRTVPTFVLGFVNIALLVKLGKYLFNRFFVIFVGRADKLVVSYFHQRPQIGNVVIEIVYEFFRRNTLFFRAFGNVLTMFVRTRQKKYVVTVFAFKARQTVAYDCGITVS